MCYLRHFFREQDRHVAEDKQWRPALTWLATVLNQPKHNILEPTTGLPSSTVASRVTPELFPSVVLVIAS
jgi:hypothetical protein